MTRMGKHTEVTTNYQQNGPTGTRERPQATSEQLRLAKLIQDPNRIEDPDVLQDKVRKVIEATKCSEQQALYALHDCDNEVNDAVSIILDGSAPKDGEWITKQGKRARRQQAAQQQNHDSQQDGEVDSEDQSLTGSDQNSGFRTGKGGNRGGFRSSDPPPRFQGRGGNVRRGGGIFPGRRGNKENEMFNSTDDMKWDTRDTRDRGRGRGRYSSGRDSSERSSRFSRTKSGGKRNDGGEIGYWQGANSNTWDNRMATEIPDPNSSNTWDNRMADHLNTANSSNRQMSAGSHVPGMGGGLGNNSSDWTNNNSVDEWNQEETDWKQGTLVFTRTNSSNRKSPSPATAIAQQIQQDSSRQANDTGSTSTHYSRQGESIDVSALLARADSTSTNFTAAAPPGDLTSGPVSSSSWTQQATNSLKNELGIGKPSTPSTVMPTASSSHAVTDQRTSKVEMPFEVGLGGGSMDIQFGFADDLNASGGSLEFQVYGQRTPAKSLEITHQQNGTVSSSASVLGAIPAHKDSGKGQGNGSLSASYPGSGQAQNVLNNSGTPVSAVTSQQSINISPQKSQVGGISQLNNGSNRPGSGSFSDTSSVAQDSFRMDMLSHHNVNVPPPAIFPTSNNSTSGGSAASWNATLSPSVNSKTVTTAAATAKQTVPTNMYNQGAQQQSFVNLGVPYLNMYGGPRPEEFLQMQAQTGVYLNPFDLNSLSQIPPFYPPQVSSVGSSAVASRENSSFSTSVPSQGSGDVKSLSGTTGSLNAPATVAPPPGFTQPSQSNAQQAAQLIAQMGGGTYPNLVPHLMLQAGQPIIPANPSPSVNAQFPKSAAQLGQANYQTFLTSYDLNDMELSKAFGPNSQQATKALLTGGPAITGVSGIDAKSYGGAPTVNKQAYEAKFGSAVTNTPPPGIGGMAGFATGFAPASNFQYPPAYLSPGQIMPPAGLAYPTAALGGDQRTGGQGGKGSGGNKFQTNAFAGWNGPNS